MGDNASYRAYLVRLWPTRRGGVAGYRVTVHSVETGERMHFADLAGLLAFWQALRISPEKDVGSQRRKKS
jgi:hypothetical protein